MTKKKIIAILFLGLVLRVISINQSLWLDEATSATVTQMSVGEIFTKFLPNDFHPPAYYLLLKLWAMAWGTSEVALRNLSVVAGVLNVYVLYLIGKEVFDKRVGLITAALLATSGLHIYFSQEVRMYILASLFVSLSIYYFVKILKKSGEGEWKLFGISMALASLTHYLTILMLPVYWIAGYTNNKSEKWFKKLFTSHNILILFWIFWLPVFYKQLTAGFGVRTDSPLWWNILGKTSVKEIFLVPTKFMIGRLSIENNYTYGLVALVIGLVFGYLLLKSLKRLKESKIFWMWLIIPTILTVIIGLFVPVFSYFRILFVLPAFYLLVAFGLRSLGKTKFKVAFVIVLLINLVTSGVYLFNPKFHREDWRGLVNYVQKETESSESKVLFVANSQMEAYNYYYARSLEKNLGCFNCPKPVKPVTISKITGDENIIWLMRYVQPIFDPEDKIRERVVGQGYEKTSEHDFNGVVVWRYQRL